MLKNFPILLRLLTAFGAVLGACTALTVTSLYKMKAAVVLLDATTALGAQTESKILAVKLINDSFWIGISALCVGAIGIIITSQYIKASIVKPISAARDAAVRIYHGDLTGGIPTGNGDETGDLLKALASMQDSLCNSLCRVQSASGFVRRVASEIASGNGDLSARAEQQAASLEQTAASMEQLTSTVRQNADNAQQASALATKASEVATRGNVVVNRAVATMSEITQRSGKIAEITGLIEGIAFQTNILALNAAVEAARAGEDGRGFAVVASEVRSLAQRSSSAAKEITELIGASLETIQLGTTEVEAAGTTMSEVTHAVSRVTDIMGEIAAASEEQSRGIEQVNQAMVQMDRVTQQNAALVEESVAAAQSLDDQGKQLGDLVATFRLATGSAG